MHFHFNKKVDRQYGPLWMQVMRHLSEILDGVTGLVMAPFDRYGTCFALLWCENILRYGAEQRKLERAVRFGLIYGQTVEERQRCVVPAPGACSAPETCHE